MKTIVSLRLILGSCLAVILAGPISAQVGINSTGALPDPSAILDVTSESKGLLSPSMSRAQRLAIASPAEGLFIYQNNTVANDLEGHYYYTGGAWIRLNNEEPYRQTVNMGSANDFEGDGSFTAAGITSSPNGTGDIGVLEVSHSAAIGGGNIPVKIITPFYLEVSAPPAIPGDLACTADFAGNCSSSSEQQWSRFTGVISPPYTGAPPSPAVLATFMFCHQQAIGACDNNPGNYNYYGSDVSIPNTNGNKCFGGGQSFGVYNAGHPGLSPGDDYQLFLKGNNLNAPATNTALSAFVDWNRDGDFFDAGEFVYSSPIQFWGTSAFNTGEITGTYTVPANAVNGPCTLRIIASRIANNTNPCPVSAQAGSSKDYSVEVVNGSAPSYPGLNRYCNIQDETTTGFTVRCYTANGQPVNTKMNILIQPQ